MNGPLRRAEVTVNDKPVRIRRSLTSTVCGFAASQVCQPVIRLGIKVEYLTAARSPGRKEGVRRGMLSVCFRVSARRQGDFIFFCFLAAELSNRSEKAED